MNIKLLTALAIALPLFTVACAKKEAPAEEATPAEATAPVDETVTAEQQAAIDSLDRPEPEAIAVEGEEPTASVETTETMTMDAEVADPAVDPAMQTKESTEVAQ